MTTVFLLLSGCASPPHEPGTVRFLIESSPNNLDLRQGTDAQSERVGALIYDALVQKDDHFQLQPMLATRWERPDARTWIFHLRPGVHFQDGKPFTADDVAWSIRSMVDGTLITSKGGAFAGVKAVTVLDPLTVLVQTAQPDAGLLFNLSDGLFGVVERGTGREEGLHPVGTGPFRFVSQVQDKDVVLERNPNYWGGAPHLARVRFAVVPDTITAALEMQKGSADAESNVLTPDMVHSLRSTPGLQVELGTGAFVFYLNMNCTDGPLRDVRVRQALAWSVHKSPLIDALWHGVAKPAESLLPPGHWAAAAPGQLPAYGYDPARAAQLLESAGYRAGPDGVRLHLTLKTSTDEGTRLVAEVLQQQMRASGIALTLRPAEFGTFYADITHGAFALYLLRWVGSNEDPDIFHYAYGSNEMPPKGGNRGHYSNAKVDSLLRDANAQTDETSRKQDYLRVQQILAVEVPSVPLWYPGNEIVHSTRLTGVVLNPGGTFAFLRTAKLQGE